MTFGTAALILVLSVFNGFEGLVKSLYSTFYTDLKIFPAHGKVLRLTEEQLQRIKGVNGIKGFSLVAEEKGILQNSGLAADSGEFNFQRAVTIKGVDSNYQYIAGLSKNIVRGEYSIGNDENAFIVLGSGVEDALQIRSETNLYPLKAYLPKRGGSILFDPEKNVSVDEVNTSGVFVIQQDFDNNYAITNLGFVKKMLGLQKNEYSGLEIALIDPGAVISVQNKLTQLLGKEYSVQTRYEQNRGLYTVMRTEKWVIYAVLVLIMIIFSFTIVSSLTMLVIEKQKDISVLHALGGNSSFIQKIIYKK